MTSRDELTQYLDDYLEIDKIADASPNGVQVEGRAKVSKVAFAVDAGVQTIAAAAKAGADMFVVHHGLFWGKHEQITGNMYKRVAALIRADMSLYAAHIPLDCHSEVGNNVELSRLLGFETERGFGEYKGVEVGVIAVSPAPVRRDYFVARVNDALSTSADVLAFGPSRVSRVAIISGAAAMEAEAARDAGCDTFLTGESSHSAFHMAREAGINLIFAGHYATETVGLKALARHLSKKFDVTTRFIPAPTGY